MNNNNEQSNFEYLIGDEIRKSCKGAEIIFGTNKKTILKVSNRLIILSVLV